MISFPEARSATENVGTFRNAVQRKMREWVSESLRDLIDPPFDPSAMRVLCEHFASEQVQRRLYPNEMQLLDEAIRDILTARMLMRDLETTNSEPSPTNDYRSNSVTASA